MSETQKTVFDEERTNIQGRQRVETESNGGDRGRPRRFKGREGTDGHRGNSRVRDRDGRFRVGRDRFRGNRSNAQSLSGERSGDGTKVGIKDTCNDTATDEEERQEGW